MDAAQIDKLIDSKKHALEQLRIDMKALLGLPAISVKAQRKANGKTTSTGALTPHQQSAVDRYAAKAAGYIGIGAVEKWRAAGRPVPPTKHN
jgi:hypothetical protein